jgi:hypothetical protein
MNVASSQDAESAALQTVIGALQDVDADARRRIFDAAAVGSRSPAITAGLRSTIYDLLSVAVVRSFCFGPYAFRICSIGS